jgi:hypothetical protein
MGRLLFAVLITVLGLESVDRGLLERDMSSLRPVARPSALQAMLAPPSPPPPAPPMPADPLGAFP